MYSFQIYPIKFTLNLIVAISFFLLKNKGKQKLRKTQDLNETQTTTSNQHGVQQGSNQERDDRLLDEVARDPSKRFTDHSFPRHRTGRSG